MSNFNSYKSPSEGSKEHIHEPLQTVLHCVQGQGLRNVSTNPPRSDELLEYPEKVPQRGKNIELLQWMESTIIQTSYQKYKGVAFQKEGGQKGRSLSSFYQQSSSQLTSPRREEEEQKELEETIFAKLQDSKNPKIFHGQCLQHVQNLYGIQGQRGTKNETTLFPNEINLSPDVVNTFTEIENNILPLKNIKNRGVIFPRPNLKFMPMPMHKIVDSDTPSRLSWM
ncbi:hypothetical protein O181_106674 [Austropuccinia psidii MF-1]|uniref:Uncharacterized protein n=1 Tax=Austropuccinia psidii MF-1 TaxID=1389203 RepID=A0A9Q3PMA5_9BASI|nr:hypothetical protein [Austropuccinia psidii MF-1]